MGDDDGALLELAKAVADGAAVDWDRAAESADTGERRALIGQLRTIARIKTVCDGGETASAAAPDGSGAWGPLRLLEKLGTGGFGEVYRAWDTRLEREVALKLLHGAVAAPEDLLDEARLLARVRHPNVVGVYGADAFEGRFGMWMELVRGSTLADHLDRQGPFGAREAALVGVDLCRALAAIHAVGLLHGDVKAQNVTREEGGRIVLMDFGVGRDLGAGSAVARAGTRRYMAPEVLMGEPATMAADIYALGVLLFHLVTLAYPLEWSLRGDPGRSPRGIRRELLRDLRPDLPDGFVQIVERALSAAPSLRYATAGAMDAALSSWLGVGGSGADADVAPGKDGAAAFVDAAARLEYLERVAEDVERLCRADGAEDRLLDRLSDLVAEGSLLGERLAPACIAQPDAPDRHEVVLSLCHLAERVESLIASRSATSAPLEGYRVHIQNAVLAPARSLLQHLDATRSRAADGEFFLFEEGAAPSVPAAEALFKDLLADDELKRHDAVVAVAGDRCELFLHELRSRPGAERDAPLRSLWSRADLLLLEGRARSRPVFEAAIELAGDRELADVWARLYWCFSAAGEKQDATSMRGWVVAQPPSSRRVFGRAFLCHPGEAYRRLALEVLEPEDFWEIVNHPGTPVPWLLEIWSHLRPRVSASFLKVFFVCVRDTIARPGGRERSLSVLDMVKEFYQVDVFHEDAFFRMLVELDDKVRAEARRHGLPVDLDADYVATLREFIARGTTRDQPIEGWSQIPLPIQRRVARLGYFLKHFISHPVDAIALECLAHLLALESVTDYVTNVAINARLLGELAKEKQLFLREDARYALVANPKTPTYIVRHHVRLLGRHSLRKLTDNRHCNQLARSIASLMLGRLGA